MAHEVMHPRPQSWGNWRQTCVQTNVLRPFQRMLKSDCSSATRCSLGRGSKDNLKGSRERTTPRGCWRVNHSCVRAIAGGCYPSKHKTSNIRSCQSWYWHPTFSYLSTAFLTASMSCRLDTKRISSAYAETFVRTQLLRRLHAELDKPPHP